VKLLTKFEIMTKFNRSAEYIAHVYRQQSQKITKIQQNFTQRTGLKFTYAFGNVYLKIDEVFQEEDNGLKNVSNGYGKLSFLGNINGKTEYLLFFKNELYQKEVNNLRSLIDMINEETRENIKYIEENHGKPNVQHCLLT
jgi:hypothetical protein